MKNMIINLHKDSIEIKDAHFDLWTRIKMIVLLFFTGYLSFKSNSNIQYNEVRETGAESNG